MSFNVTYTFTPGEDGLSAQVNQNFQDIVGAINSGVGGAFPTVLNAANYNFLPGNSASTNTTGLQAAVNAIIAAGGGILFVPLGAYQISGAITITGLPQAGCIIQGSSSQTQILQQSKTTNTFNVSNFSQGSRGGGGLRFRNLWFENQGGTPTSGGDTTGTGIALNLTGGTQNVTAEECVFFNCPQAFFADNHDLQSGLIRCLIVQNVFSLATDGQVHFEGAQDFADYCILRQMPIINGGNAPRNNTGFALHPNHSRITNTHVVDFDYGIKIAGASSQDQFVSNCNIESWTTAVIIQPPNNTSTFYGAYFDNTTIEQSLQSTSQTVGIYLDTNGGMNTNVENINFVGCTVANWANSGLYSRCARSINIVGGRWGANGQNPGTGPNGESSTLMSCAVSASSGVGGITSGLRLVGVDMAGVYDKYSTTPQPYAVGLNGGSPSMRCWDCTMTGMGIQPVYVGTTIGAPDLKMYNCTGYNDTAPLVSTSGISSGSPFMPASQGYYGPVSVYTAGGTGVGLQINGHALYGAIPNGATGFARIPDSHQTCTPSWSTPPTIVIIGE